jgi:glycosyltransferase involved in cell wall biosynthesis
MLLPKIGVIIPWYAYARCVEQAIDSVLAQRHPALDLVVVNDGSRDESLAVIRCHAPSATILDQPNRGHVASCNAGFAASTGDVVAFLDADDLLEQCALIKVAQAWSLNLAKTWFDLNVIGAEGNALGRRLGQFRPDFAVQRVRDDLARRGTYRWPVTSGNGYSRWFVSLLFAQAFEGLVDGYLNAVAPLYGDVLTLYARLGRYRLNDRNLSQKTRASSNSCLVLLKKALTKLWHEGLSPMMKAMRAVWFLALAMMPRPFVSPTIALRFSREQWKRSWKHRLLGFGIGGI